VKPEVTLPDPEKAVIDLLVAAGRTGVSTDFPSAKLTGTNTRVQVELEASDTSGYPVTERAQVRVVAYAAPGKRDNVKALAQLLLSDLYSYAGSASVAGVVPISGRSAVTTDPSNQNVACWVLVRVDLKASLAS
jgi:hypothetical protein